MYTSTHLDWMDNVERHPNGWPKFVPPEAQEWATERVREIVEGHHERHGKWLPLHEITDRLFLRHRRHETPECFRDIALWDALHGITHRALLSAKYSQLWGKSEW